MTPQDLRDKIKGIVKQVYSSKKIDLDNGTNISLDTFKYPVLSKFPSLKKVIIDLLTDQYEIFITDIQWVAPRPTTFRIVLGNEENFLLIYTQRSWIAKVEGKKYYLLNLSEEEQAAQSISRILSYGDKEFSKTPDDLLDDEDESYDKEDKDTEEETPEEEV